MADILTREVPSEPCITFDGTEVAYVVSHADTMGNGRSGDIYSVRIDSTTGAPGVPRKWSSNSEVETELRWAPNDHVLAYRRRLPAQTHSSGVGVVKRSLGPSQVWIQYGPDEKPQSLTDAPEGIDSYRWLSDGSGVVTKSRQPLSVAEERRRQREVAKGRDGRTAGADQRPWEFRVWLLGRGTSSLIATIGPGLGDWDLSPDNRWIVYASNGGDPHDEESPTDLWLYDRTERSTRRLTSRWGPDTLPRFTYDGTRIVWMADQDTSITYSQEDVWIMNRDGTDQRCLSAEIDEALMPVGSCPAAWKDGFVVVERASRSRSFLGLLPLGGSEGVYDRGPHTSFISEVGPRSEAQRVVLVGESLESWPEVWIASISLVGRSGTIENRAITDFNHVPSPVPIPRLRFMESHSTDGFTTESILALPDTTVYGPGPYPTITQLHGGPYNRNTARLRDNATALVLASHGYLVYMPNFRGSKGYGNAFGTAARGRDFAEGPYRDVMAGLDSLIAQGLADSTRLGIMGGSYGGYLSMFAITRTDRFKAAVSMYGMSSLITDFGNGRSPSYELEYLGEPYWKGNPLWTELSPAWHVDKIHTPLLLLHGENDPAVGISNSREMWTALTVLKRPVEFITYPREGHGFREPNHRIDACRRTVAWFDRYLK
jgi:dipeptidyl aminopeptidase/acylaminoacyl peptidase